jgi:hypothetical protein
MLWLASSPISVLERLWARRVFRDRPGSWLLVFDGFMTQGHSTPSVLEAAQANALAFVGQPWSYLRLKAYSFFGLCEGAYGDFGGSVLNDCTRGLTHRWILSLDPERRKNRLANHRVSKPGPAWFL